VRATKGDVVVLTNPPFGKKSSMMVVNSEGEQDREALVIAREDFIATTSNKQLNFVQHVKSVLKVNGRAGVVVPDNVLFEGGAGETIRRDLLATCDVHTLLCLPTGIFYAQGVKANVLFFDVMEASERPWTDKLWIYDLRTNRHFTLKTKPLQRADPDEFVACYNPENRHERRATWSEDNPDGRWRSWDYDDLVARDKANLDIFWLRDESLDDAASLEEPDVIAAEIIEDLQTALDEIALIYADLAEDPAWRGASSVGAVSHSVNDVGPVDVKVAWWSPNVDNPGTHCRRFSSLPPPIDGQVSLYPET
jgi:type I restriction enzyme M protein